MYAIKFEVIDPNQYLEEDRLAEMDDPISFAMKATSNPNTMYMGEAMKELDANEFRKAMVKEVVDHTKKGHWEVMEKKDLPAGYKLLLVVWEL